MLTSSFRSGPGSGSTSSYGSGSGKKYRILTEPDPQHWLNMCCWESNRVVLFRIQQHLKLKIFTMSLSKKLLRFISSAKNFFNLFNFQVVIHILNFHLLKRSWYPLFLRHMRMMTYYFFLHILLFQIHACICLKLRRKMFFSR
jgi:hypothetical protein